MSYLEIKMICENDENGEKTQEVSGEDRSETNYFKNKSKWKHSTNYEFYFC